MTTKKTTPEQEEGSDVESDDDNEDLSKYNLWDDDEDLKPIKNNRSKSPDHRNNRSPC